MLKKYILRITIFLIAVLIVSSVFSAFVGPAKTENAVNSDLSAGLFFGFLIFMTVATFAFKSLYKKPALLIIHVGFVLLIVGSMINSRKGNEIFRKFGMEKVFEGKMVIFEGRSENKVRTTGGKIEELPFEIRLEDFRIEHYEPYIIFKSKNWKTQKIAAVERNISEILPDGTMLEVEEVFENFKIVFDDGRKAIDSKEVGYNPAVKIKITNPTGKYFDKFLFSKQAGHEFMGDDFELSYHAPIRDYISDISVLENGEVLKSSNIEVNKPFHFKGYHFYQSSYDDRQGSFTVLKVVSDTGLYLVYLSFVLIGAGIVWHFWINRTVGVKHEN